MAQTPDICSASDLCPSFHACCVYFCSSPVYLLLWRLSCSPRRQGSPVEAAALLFVLTSVELHKKRLQCLLSRLLVSDVSSVSDCKSHFVPSVCLTGSCQDTEQTVSIPCPACATVGLLLVWTERPRAPTKGFRVCLHEGRCQFLRGIATRGCRRRFSRRKSEQRLCLCVCVSALDFQLCFAEQLGLTFRFWREGAAVK